MDTKTSQETVSWQQWMELLSHSEMEEIAQRCNLINTNGDLVTLGDCEKFDRECDQARFAKLGRI